MKKNILIFFLKKMDFLRQAKIFFLVFDFSIFFVKFPIKFSLNLIKNINCKLFRGNQILFCKNSRKKWNLVDLFVIWLADDWLFFALTMQIAWFFHICFVCNHIFSGISKLKSNYNDISCVLMLAQITSIRPDYQQFNQLLAIAI